MSSYKFPSGTRIRLAKASGTVFSGEVLRADPFPQHCGKEGQIVKYVSFDRYETPLIRLDDGTELRGHECWWEPITAPPPTQAGKPREEE